MRYLIDSNILILSIVDTGQLTREVRDILNDYGNLIYVPAKCVEELIYLQQTRKVTVQRWKTADDIIDNIKELNFGIKYIAEEHLRTLAKLPLFPDHKDPTDRIIVAQAITEKIALISSDRKFPLYVRYGLDFVFNKR